MIHRLARRVTVDSSPAKHPPYLRSRLGVLVGDVLVLALFVVIGITDHGGNPAEIPAHTLEVLVPFLLAWLLLAPLAGLYHRQTLTDYRVVLVSVPLTWVGVAVGGALIRATPVFTGGASATFILVTILFGTLLLLPWRLAVVWLFRR